jgi:hypothetical protein
MKFAENLQERRPPIHRPGAAKHTTLRALSISASGMTIGLGRSEAFLLVGRATAAEEESSHAFRRVAFILLAALSGRFLRTL